MASNNDLANENHQKGITKNMQYVEEDMEVYEEESSNDLVNELNRKP